MPNMRRLIRIDTRVLHQNLPRRNSRFGLWNRRLGWGVSENRRSKLPAIDASIDVSGTCNFQLLEAFDRADLVHDLMRNSQRRFSELFRQLKRQRKCVLSEFNSGGLLDGKKNTSESVLIKQEW